MTNPKPIYSEGGKIFKGLLAISKIKRWMIKFCDLARLLTNKQNCG